MLRILVLTGLIAIGAIANAHGHAPGHSNAVAFAQTIDPVTAAS